MEALQGGTGLFTRSSLSVENLAEPLLPTGAGAGAKALGEKVADAADDLLSDKSENGLNSHEDDALSEAEDEL